MTALDRSRPPAPAPDPPMALPEIRHVDVGGARAVAVDFDAVPITRVALAVPGAGRLREEPARLGLASLVGGMLREGTGALDGVALQETLDGLGATLDVEAGDDELVVYLTVLNRELARAAELVREVVHAPRLVEEDFGRLVRRRLVELESRADDPARVAQDAWRGVVHGADRVEGMAVLGTPETVAGLVVDDARGFWGRGLAEGGARVAWVGSVEGGLLAPIFSGGGDGHGDGHGDGDGDGDVETAAFGGGLYVTDMPGAPQTELRIGHPGVSATHPDFFPLQAVNHPLGGSFTSRLNLELRERRGWTYGARSGFDGGLRPGSFTVATAVHTEATGAAIEEVLIQLDGFLGGVTDEETEFTRKSLVQALCTRYDSSWSRLHVACNVARYGWPTDYPARRVAWLRGMTRDDLARLAEEHIRPRELAILAVGDGEALRPQLEGLGIGPPVELDRLGRRLSPSA